MRTLVYFASGCDRYEYQQLDFDRIILIDNCFKNRKRYPKSIFNTGKVTCIGMDCLESVKFLKSKKVKVDYFVSLNEGLYEGGGRYAINSDMFLGYVMPLLKENYIHIMNKNYYLHSYKVSMDLPYNVEEISEKDKRYLSPFIFSKDDYHKGYAKVFQMKRIKNNTTYVPINNRMKLLIIHDSIWNYYDSLDYLVLSYTQQGQRDFFTKKFPNTIDINNTTIKQIFEKCVNNKISTIGFIPWAKGNYSDFIKLIETYNENYPKEIRLFHLNRKDYQQIKEYAGNNGS